MNDVLILGGARTPMTEYVGALKDVSAIELGAIAARGAFQKTGVKPEWIDHVVFGNVLQTSADAIYGARHVALKACVPVEVPALTVNRLCGSGIQAAITGAHHIVTGEADVVLTGGIENMSQAPHVIRGLRSGLKLGQGALEDSLFEGLRDTMCGLFMAETAEKCATNYSISRDEQDRYAIRSQKCADDAWKQGRFADEVVPVEIKTRRGTTVVDRDDHMRPDTTIEALGKLPTAFSKDGTVTAGNASGIVDGGAAVVLASEAGAKARGATPLARLTGWATVGVDPSIMGMGPAPAIRKLLEKKKLALADIDLFEINEAFAVVAMAAQRDLGIPREKLNINGGACALGHPIGATGARLIVTLLHALEAHNLKRGVAALCIGGGEATAIAIERIVH
jgi:acetyl-CoA acetyltransferase family protein